MEQSLWERLWTNRRRQILTAACVLGLVVIAVYIWLIFSPGVRYRGVFLSPQEDGSYAGSSLEYAYRLAVAPGSGETSIDFTVNGETRTYRVVRTPRENGSGEEVSIYRDGEFAARTDAWPNAGAYSLDVYAIDGYVLETFSEGSFPTFSQLYEWSAAFQTDTRGYPVFLLLFFSCPRSSDSGHCFSESVFLSSAWSGCRRGRAERLLPGRAEAGPRCHCRPACSHHLLDLLPAHLTGAASKTEES